MLIGIRIGDLRESGRRRRGPEREDLLDEALRGHCAVKLLHGLRIDVVLSVVLHDSFPQSGCHSRWPIRLTCAMPGAGAPSMRETLARTTGRPERSSPPPGSLLRQISAGEA